MGTKRPEKSYPCKILENVILIFKLKYFEWWISSKSHVQLFLIARQNDIRDHWERESAQRVGWWRVKKHGKSNFLSTTRQWSSSCSHKAYRGFHRVRIFIDAISSIRLPFHKYANSSWNVVFLAYKIYKLHEKKLDCIFTSVTKNLVSTSVMNIRKNKKFFYCAYYTRLDIIIWRMDAPDEK